MQVYDSFQKFWNDYSATQPNIHGFQDWQVVQILHTSNTDYAKQVAHDADELGFQPLTILLADPLKKQTKRLLVKNVDDKLANDFRVYSRTQYSDQLANRFVNLKADTFHAFAEYDNWQSFYNSWLERDGKPVFMHNLPLLFDHTPKIDYWARKQTGQKVLPHQRMLITTYFINNNKFFDFFIKNVSDDEAERIKLITLSRLALNIDLLFPGTRMEQANA